MISTTFGDEAEVFVFDPGSEVDGESVGQLLGGVEDVGDAVLVASGHNGTASARM